MSSTNRGGVREVSDYYVTPVADIHSFLTAWSADCGEHGLPNARYILDPCAGGTEGREPMSYPKALFMGGFFPEARVTTMDIRQDSRAQIKMDYLTSNNRRDFDLIITNPPFAIAREVIEKALREVRDGGYVVMLLRLNYLGSEERLTFWHRNTPQRIYVHSKRMKFRQHLTHLPAKERNATDSIEYAHFVWWTGHTSGESRLRVI